MKWIFLCISLMQMPFLFSQTRISGNVDNRSADYVVIMYWKQFALNIDTLSLDKRGQFHKAYPFDEPTWLNIYAEQTTRILLLPGENLQVRFKGREVELRGSAEQYNSFLLDCRNTITEMKQAKLAANVIIDTMFNRSAIFFASFQHKDAELIKKLHNESFISQVKLYPLLFVYNDNKPFLDTLSMIIQGKGTIALNSDRWRYLPEIDFGNDVHRYSHDYINMIQNIVKMIGFHAADRDAEGIQEDPYLRDIGIIKAMFQPSLLRTCIIANNLFSRISYYNEYPTLLGGIDDFIGSFTQEDYAAQYLSLLDSVYAGVKAGFSLLSPGSKAPQFNLPDRNRKTVSLSALKNKVVYLDIWATWCGPCLKELPYLEEIKKKYEHKMVEIVSISIDTDQSLWLKKIETMNLGGIQLIDSKGSVKSETAIDYRISGVPHFVLIDKNGKIVYAAAPRPSDTEALTRAIDALLE